MSAYYNENDPRMAAWLRTLIRLGLIAAGEVDGRSILDVRSTELRGFTQCHFFAGIGGWSYALRLAGWPDGQKVWTGSCPCQPFSCAGQGKGEADDRHLWPVFRELIRESEIDVCFGEQVASAAGRIWLAGVQNDLEGMGFEFGAADLCSASVGAPNIRQRLYWLANADAGRFSSRSGAKPEGAKLESGHSLSEQRSGDERLAESDRLQTEQGSPRPSREEGRQSSNQSSRCGHVGSGRMGEPILEGLEGHARNGDDRHEPGRERTQEIGPITQTGDLGGLVFSDGARRQSGQQASATTRHGNTAKPTGFWNDSIWHLCTDENQRRIPAERAFFPLASRLPGRVAMLRGIGNAINPEIASEFIQAFMDLPTR